DVSSNQLSGIEDVVLEFPSLQVLYYHGNHITNINEVLKLQALPRLNKLTLHGNPIAESKTYKLWVVAHLPGLRNMDFGAITRLERDKVDTWFRSTKKRAAK
ncbi:Leucine-rich repeat-containing protein 51, partial [Tetrabaena socialis]